MNPANSTTTPSARNPWPYAIIAWFVLFGTGMFVWACVAMRQNLDLVSSDYYDHEIRYQQQIDRQARTQPLQSDVKLAYDAARQTISIVLPAAHVAQAMGSVVFYRPSDAKLDRVLKLSVNTTGEQTVDATALRAGLWKIRVQWTINGEEFYYEQRITIVPNS